MFRMVQIFNVNLTVHFVANAKLPKNYREIKIKMQKDFIERAKSNPDLIRSVWVFKQLNGEKFIVVKDPLDEEENDE